MATKTISLDLAAYEALCRLRREPRESFSQVIHRLAEGAGAGPVSRVTSELFAEGERRWLPPESALDRLDEYQARPRARRDVREGDGA